MTKRSKNTGEIRSTLRHLRHEMRTPIGHIMGYSEILEEEVRDRGQEDLVPDLEKIRGAAQKLLQVVEDVFQSDAEGEPAGPSQQGPALEDAPAPGTATGSLLIVDDEPQNRELLTRGLEGAGYQIGVAADGREALHAIEAGDFDLVLLDVMMPGMSGLEVLEAIRRTRSVSDLPVIIATALGGSEDVVEALRLGANDYVTKPLDFSVVRARVGTQLSLKRAAREISDLASQLEIRNAFIRRAFGRYVSDEIVDDILESPGGLEIRGEKRRVSILIGDIRGFSSITEALSPIQVVSLLNGYLGSMAEVIQSHGGTVDEFIGDAVLAFFGAPVARGDDTERAVAAAVAMQLAMDGVNVRNREAGLPEIEMGIGIATGHVIVGNIGSEYRTKYGAVGASVNLASRIESFTVGGEILIDDATRNALMDLVRIAEERQVQPKGLDAPIRIHLVSGIGGSHGLALADRKEELTELTEEIALRFAVLEGKRVPELTREGSLCALSRRSASLRSEDSLPHSANLLITLLDDDGTPLPGPFYAKVVVGSIAPRGLSLIRFTTRSTALEEAVEVALDERGPR